ncbi:MAG TPA: PDZ domain-containing protein, partial [Acidimicrobiales bacterium]|nr:PDZ domain-containing protein [Acidimicrobiales bacterium]
LSELHYRVSQVPEGALVTTVYVGTPAWHAGVQCNDVFVAVNGKPVRTAADLVDFMRPLRSGTTVVLTVRAGSAGRAREVKIRLVGPPAKLVAEGYQSRVYMGVELATESRPELPFPVAVNAGQIGGPSAGLAFTLGILDALSGGELTGGHVLAATGTIDPEGDVGDVGGVQEKTVAVRQAGAQVFFVPEVEYAVARREAGKTMQVVPVSSLSQVLRILEQRYGGRLGDSAGKSQGFHKRLAASA